MSSRPSIRILQSARHTQSLGLAAIGTEFEVELPRVSKALRTELSQGSVAESPWTAGIDEQQVSNPSSGASSSNKSSVPACETWKVVFSQYLYFQAIGIMVAVYPEVLLALDFFCGDPLRAGTFVNQVASMGAMLEFLSAAFWAAMSDQYGRKPFLILASVGQIIDYSIIAFAARDCLLCEKEWNGRCCQLCGASFENGHYWVLVGKIACGLAGSFSIFSKAYIADTVAADHRAWWFGAVGSCLGIAFTVGPPLGIVLSRYSLQVPIMLAVLINVMNIFWILHISESVPKSKQTVPFHWSHGTPWGTLRFLLTTPFLGLFATMNVADQMSTSIVTTNIIMFVKEAFDADQMQYTGLLTYVGACIMLVNTLILRTTLKRWGYIRTLQCGYILSCLGYLMVAGFTRFGNFWLMFVPFTVTSLGALSNPTQLSIACSCVASSEQGLLQGAKGSLDVIGRTVGPLLASAVWHRTASAGFPEGIWWTAGVIVAPGLCIALRINTVLPAGVLEEIE